MQIWTLRLSPERKSELAPNRVSFSDTPPSTTRFSKSFVLAEIVFGFMSSLGEIGCGVDCGCFFCVKFVYANF